jgi:hypothetical protein
MAVNLTFLPSANASTLTKSVDPLKTLHAGSTNVEILKYPNDLGSDTKNHYVQIYIKNVSPASYDGIKMGNGRLETDAGSLIKNFASSFVNFSKSAFNFNLRFDNPLTETVSVISLYMPETLQSVYGATYDTISITGDLGAGIRGVQAVNSGAGNLNSNAMNKGNASSVSPAAITLLSSILGSTAEKFGVNLKNIGDLLIKGQGFGINPQLQMIYRGTNFRSFQLAFMFSPKSAEEAETVDKIINTLRYHFSPTLATGGGSSNDSMFLIPPSIFNIQFKLNSNENKFLPKYGDCVLESIDVDNAPNGFASYDDGASVQTRLTLQFKEIVIVDRGMINEGTLR